MKSGTGEISEKERQIAEEEEKKRQESQGRYSMYADYIDDAEASSENDPEDQLTKLQLLDKRMEKRSGFKDVSDQINPEDDFSRCRGLNKKPANQTLTPMVGMPIPAPAVPENDPDMRPHNYVPNFKFDPMRFSNAPSKKFEPAPAKKFEPTATYGFWILKFVSKPFQRISVSGTFFDTTFSFRRTQLVSTLMTISRLLCLTRLQQLSRMYRHLNQLTLTFLNHRVLILMSVLLIPYLQHQFRRLLKSLCIVMVSRVVFFENSDISPIQKFDLNPSNPALRTR